MRSKVSGVGHMHDLMDSLFEHALKFHKKNGRNVGEISEF